MILRTARHTNNLDAIRNFYVEILGLRELGAFENHDGYDGIFLGIENSDWHLEFTISSEKAVHTFAADDFLVFYPKTQTSYDIIIKQIESRHLKIHSPRNPYWKNNGILIKDPDGFGIIVSNLKIKHSDF